MATEAAGSRRTGLLVVWHCSDEFTDHLNSLVVGNAVRVGVRHPGTTALSLVPPDLAAESSWTQNADYYWEHHAESLGPPAGCRMFVHDKSLT